MLFFFLLILFVSLLCRSKNSLRIAQTALKIPIPVIAYLIIVLISLLRFDVGWDYKVYYQAVAGNDIYAIRRFEPLSQLFFQIAFIIQIPQFVFILFGVPTYALILTTIRHQSKNIGFSILLYFCFFYLESLGFIRQALAVAICFYAIKYIQTRRFLPFFICTIIAVLFHYSAVLYLCAYPLYGRVKLNQLIWFLPLLFVVREIVFILLDSIGLYTFYLEELYTMKGGSLIRFFYIFLFFSLFLFKRKQLSDSENYYFFMIGLALSFPFLLGSHLGVRLSSYFYIYYILLIPNIVDKAKVRFAYTLTALAFLLFTLFLTTKDPVKSQYIPYQFIFEVGNQPVFKEEK